MSEHMMLTHRLQLKKLEYPVYITEKIDGIPGIYYEEDGVIKCKSRQGKPILSTQHICDTLSKFDLEPGFEIIGEHYIPGKEFAEIGGAVRQHENHPDLKLYVFDYVYPNCGAYQDRFIKEFIDEFYTVCARDISILDSIIYSKAIKVDSQDAIEPAKQQVRLHAKGTKFEGYIYKNANGLYEYKRSWNCMKEVIEQTVDLQVVEVLEAVDKHGVGMNMVGTLKCKTSTNDIYNVSPGKSSHSLRKDWWSNPDKILNKIITVKYKPDDTYENLRQPTYQHIHEDKVKPD